MKYPLRSMYVASPGNVLISLDLSQAETWVVAHMANEYGMKDALKNGDIHSRTACVFYGGKEEDLIRDKKSPDPKVREAAGIKRYGGKQGNHSLSYRMTPPMLMRQFNEKSDQPPYLVITIREATRLHTLWHSYYTGIKQWWATIETELKMNKRTLITPYGRKMRYFEYWGEELFKQATASLPQSTVADHAFGKVQEELGIEGGILGIYKTFKLHPEIKLIQTSHDSVIMDTPKGIWKEVAEVMYKNMHRPMVVREETFTIPVDIEMGERWGELEKVKL